MADGNREIIHKAFASSVGNWALHKLYPVPFHMDRMIELLPNQAAYDAIASGQDPRRIAEDWREPLEKFQQLRQKYLIYK